MASNTNGSMNKRVLIIGADGLRPDMVKAEWMPTYAKLMEKGTLFKQFYAAYPPQTRVSMTTLTTGVYPGRHGVVGNSMYVPGFHENGLVQTGNDQHLLEFPKLVGEPFVLSPTLGDRLFAHGKRLAVAASSSPGASLLWNINHPELVINPSSYYEQPALKALHEQMGEVPEETGGLKARRLEWSTRVLIDVYLADQANEVMVLWLTEPDNSQHHFGLGSPENIAALKVVDNCVSSVLEAVEQLGLGDQLDILLISDHGHSTIDAQGSMKEHVNKACLELSIESKFIVTGDFIYAHPDSQWNMRGMERLIHWLHNQEWCGKLISGDPNVALLPGVLSIERITGPAFHNRSPLLAISPKWSDEANPHGIPGTVKNLYPTSIADKAAHGVLSPYDLKAFCLGYGPSFVEGASSESPCGIVDIAPTVCHILGLTDEQGFDGRVLVEGLREQRDRSQECIPPMIEIYKYL